MNHPTGSLMALALAVALCVLLVPLPGLAQSPDGATMAPAAALGLGTYHVVHNDSSLTELAPAVAYNSVRHEYLVVWYNDRPGNDDVRAQRLAADGRLLGGPFYISAGAGADRTLPDVAYCEKQDQYLVVWQHYEPSAGTSVHGRRVSGTGLVLDASDIVIRSAGANLYTPSDPAVAYAYTSDKYLVVWHETWHPMPISRDILGQVVGPDGALDGGYITVANDTPGNYTNLPALAYNRARNEYLVAWEQYDAAYSIWCIYARRVTGEGVLLYPEAITIIRVTTSNTRPSVAAIAGAGTDGVYLVTHELHYTSTDDNIYARHVSGDGTVLPGFYVAYAGVRETQPVVAGSESSGSFFAAWKREADAPLILTYVYGRQIAASGGSSSEEQYAGGVFGNSPAVSAGLGGDFLVVFEDTPLGGGSTGIYARLFGERAYIPMTLRAY